MARGLDTYSFDELWLDYRRCVVRNLTIPNLFWSRGMKPEGWWHRLECALAARVDCGMNRFFSAPQRKRAPLGARAAC